MTDPPDPNDGPWLVEFKPVGDGPPMAVRMRSMLKAALRSYGLRATTLRNGFELDASSTPAERGADAG